MVNKLEEKSKKQLSEHQKHVNAGLLRGRKDIY